MGNGTSLAAVAQTTSNQLLTSTEILNDRIQTEDSTWCTPRNMSRDKTEEKMLKLLRNTIGIPVDRPFSAKYVKYIPKLYGIQEDKITIWWFPSDFCQSRLGDRQIGSNACTLIVVILAHRIHDQGISIFGELDQPLSRHLINAFAESIVDGNEIHEYIAKKGDLVDINMTLPEAMKCYEQTQGEWQLNRPTTNPRRRLIEWRSSIEMEAAINSQLFEILHSGLMQWESEGRTQAPEDSNLYFVLISSGRSVLLVYQRHLRKVTLIDSHGHLDYGAVVCQVDICDLWDLCDWYAQMCKNYFQSLPTCFEISFLYFEVQ